MKYFNILSPTNSYKKDDKSKNQTKERDRESVSVCGRERERESVWCVCGGERKREKYAIQIRKKTFTKKVC